VACRGDLDAVASPLRGPLRSPPDRTAETRVNGILGDRRPVAFAARALLRSSFSSEGSTGTIASRRNSTNEKRHTWLRESCAQDLVHGSQFVRISWKSIMHVLQYKSCLFSDLAIVCTDKSERNMINKHSVDLYILFVF